MKKILMLAMVIGLFLLCSNLVFGGEWKILPLKFEDGTICSIPSDWKLVSVHYHPGVGSDRLTDLWFQDKEGSVYIVTLEKSQTGGVASFRDAKAFETVYKIKSK